MKILIPFLVILFCSCNSSQNIDVSTQKDVVAFDSVETALPVQDSVIDYGSSGYTHLLEIISEYSFNTNLTSTYDEAMEWLSDEGLEVSSAYSEEESHYNIDFEIRSTNEDASCAFHYEYSSDGDYSTYRHIIINVQEDLKSAFIEELKVWYSGALELESVEAKCFQKSGEPLATSGKRKRNMGSFSQAFNDRQRMIPIPGLNLEKIHIKMSLTMS